MLKFLPVSLVALRVVLAPIIFVLLRENHFQSVALLYFIALLSDIFDGVIARRLGVSTLALRIGDGVADIWLYLWLGIGLLISMGRELSSLAFPFYLAMGLQIGSWIFCFVKFRKLTSYHSWMAKWTGLALFAGIQTLLLRGGTWPLGFALWFFALNILEEISMTALLPKYHHDVWSLRQAFSLRREDLAAERG